MKFVCPLIAVSDLKASRAFYETVLSQKVTLDLGWNLSFENNAFALQEHYDLLASITVTTGSKSNDHELYFEEKDFDGFTKHLESFPNIEYAHRAKEYEWGQRVVRFYDPDRHIIEVGESMESVFKRFHSAGMSAEEVAKRTAHPLEYVKQFI